MNTEELYELAEKRIDEWISIRDLAKKHLETEADMAALEEENLRKTFCDTCANRTNCVRDVKICNLSVL